MRWLGIIMASENGSGSDVVPGVVSLVVVAAGHDEGSPPTEEPCSRGGEKCFSGRELLEIAKQGHNTTCSRRSLITITIKKVRYSAIQRYGDGGDDCQLT